MDSKPYDKPELSRFGDFRDLTRGDPAGKTVGGADLHPVHEHWKPQPGDCGLHLVIVLPGRSSTGPVDPSASTPSSTTPSPSMHVYRAFGRSLHSEVALPDLPRQRDGGCDWLLRIDRGALPERAGLVAEQEVGTKWLRVWRSRAGILFVYEPVGAFEISGDGREMTWFPAAAPLREELHAVLLGPVIALALHAQGTPCLHGSAVRLGREGAAFLAPKGSGKSTLVTALVEAGGQLITDDTLAVALHRPPLLLSGVHSVKLWTDSFDKMAPRLPSRVGEGPKRTLRGFPRRARRSGSTPCSAVYALRPDGSGSGVAVRRKRLPPQEAALALLANAKIAPFLEPSGAALLLKAATTIAESVPVYSLSVPRDWARLPDVVRTLLAWHGPVRAGPAPMGSGR